MQGWPHQYPGPGWDQMGPYGPPPWMQQQQQQPQLPAYGPQPGQGWDRMGPGFQQQRQQHMQGPQQWGSHAARHEVYQPTVPNGSAQPGAVPYTLYMKMHGD